MIPLGAWSFKTGIWQPNDLLTMTVEQQHWHNYTNGFTCQFCYRMPTMCVCKETADKEPPLGDNTMLFVAGYLSENWSSFVSYCKNQGLTEDSAETIVQALES